MAIGPTGEHPRGKLNDDDEGALKIAVWIERDVVRLDFGKKIAWLGLPKQEAMQLAGVLIMHARNLPD